MQIRTETLGTDITALYPVGRLNMVSSSTFRRTAQDAIDHGRPRIVIDLAGVTSIDSSGIGTFIRCLKTARAAGGDLRITAPTKQVQTMLRLALLFRLFPTYESVETAYPA